MNSFAALSREEFGVEVLSRHVLLVPWPFCCINQSQLDAHVLFGRYLLCQCTTARERCSKEKTFFYLTFFTVSYHLKKILTYFFCPRVEH